MFKSLKDFNFQDRRVLLRCDFNVPIEQGRVLDDFRLKKALPTINYLNEKGAKIILLSHLGRPEKGEKLSLRPVAEKLKELLGRKVKFLKECVGKKVKKKIDKMKAGEVALLENLRFEKGEEANEENFAYQLAELGDVYVSEAFSVSHRAHASIVRVPKLLPSLPGFLLTKEIETLSKISKNPQRPLVVVLGGVKISSKIKALVKLLPMTDHVLLGGKVANALLVVKGISIGRPWPEETVAQMIKGLNLTSLKIHLPIDVVASSDESGEFYIRETGPGNVRKEEKILDIGEETIQTFKQIIREARTIVWSGPLGLYEEPHFRKGTEEIGQAIARAHSAFRVAGGGDTVKALRQFNLLQRFDFISTGGGAMLFFLAGETLPGLDALKI